MRLINNINNNGRDVVEKSFSRWIQKKEKKNRASNETKAKTYKHQLHEHLQHMRAEIHAWSVCEVLVDVSKCSGRSEKSVDSLVESSSGHTILLGGQLCVKCAGIEKNRGFFKGDCSLTTWHPCQ